MADLWQALRDSMDGMASEARAHVKQVDVYSKAEGCRAYCATKGSGLEYILKEESCLCQKGRPNLRKRGLNARQDVQTTHSTSIFTIPGGPMSGSVVTSVAIITTTISDASESTPTSDSTNDGVQPTNTALSTPTGAGGTQQTIASDGDGPTATPATTTDVNGAASTSGYPTADGAGATISNGVKESNNSSGLSQSGKIGLGVGLGVGLAVLIAAIVLFCLARRRKRRGAAMGGKYAHAQSDLSMVEAPYPTAAGVAEVRETPKEYQEPPHYEPPRYSQYERDNELVEDHREAVEEVDDRASEEFEPPHNVFQTPLGQSPVTPLEPGAHNRSFTNAPLALAIPSAAGGASSPHSRDLSPAGGGSPVSPVSPVSAVSPINSRPSSPTRHH